MEDVAELIYETCKTYLITQGKFILILELLVGVIIAGYYGWLCTLTGKVAIIFVASVARYVGSYSVAWFGMRINTMANSRSAFGSLAGKPFPDLRYTLKGRDVHRHAFDQHRTFCHAVHFAIH